MGLITSRKKRPLEREAKTLRDTKLIIIASEDEYAPKQYFEQFKSIRCQVKVIPPENGKSAPVHVLECLDTYM